MILGDFMKNTIISIFICLIIGLFLSFSLFKQYEKPAGKEVQTVYFLQISVYSDIDSLNKNININQYIYSEEKDGVHVYAAITKDNKDLLEEFFQNKGYQVYTKEVTMYNEEFLKELESADMLLKQVTDEKSIMAIIRQVLEKYEATK